MHVTDHPTSAPVTVSAHDDIINLYDGTATFAAGMIAVALTPNMKIAAVCSSYMYSLFHLFAGFVITQVNMPGWW